MNTNNTKSWLWNRESEQALYEEHLLPLQAAFESALASIPEEQRLSTGGAFIDELWNTVYQKNFPAQSLIETNGVPDVSTSLLKNQKQSSRVVISAPTPYRPDANTERLALVFHHNCALKSNGQSAFQQALSTAIMQNSSLIQEVVGKADRWDYLADKKVEPVQYPNPFRSQLTASVNAVGLSLKKLWCFVTRKQKSKSPVEIFILKHANYNKLSQKAFNKREKIAIQFLKSARGQV